MKAVQIAPRAQRAELIELEELPVPTGTQVRVRVLQVGLCATDQALLAGTLRGYSSSSRAMVIGHEMVGSAVELGQSVRTVQLGDLVVATVRRGCGICVSCFQGQGDLCYTGLYSDRGVRDADGFMVEYTLEEEANLVVVPMQLHDVAVLLEPLSLVAKAITVVRTLQQRILPRCGHPSHSWERARWGRCKRVLVTGAGAQGLLSALALRDAGAEVYLYGQERDSLRERIVRLSGGEYISAQEVALATLPNWVAQVDLIVETTGEPGVPAHLAPLMAPNALLVLLGDPATEAQNLNASAGLPSLAQSNGVLVGCTSSSREHFQQAVTALKRLLRTSSSAVSQIITHRFPLSQFQEALAFNDPSAIKVVVNVSEIPS